MSLNFFSLKLHPGWICSMACLAVVCISHAADPRSGRPIEISAPRGESINTNVNQLRLSGLKNLEADLSKPFQSLSPKSSLDGIMAPQMLPQPQPAPILSQKERQMRDRRKNWAFSSPEELGPDLTPEKIFGLKEYDANGVEKGASTAMERFSERLTASARGTNQFNLSDSDATNSFSGEMGGDSRRDGMVFPTVNPATAVFKPATEPRPFSDVFSFDNRDTEEILRDKKAQQAHVDSFRQLWNYDQGQDAGATASAFQSSGFTPATATPSPAKTFQPVFGTVTATPKPSTASSLAPQPPAQPPARITTFQPDFTAPQRRF